MTVAALSLTPDQLRPLGQGLVRPECVQARPDGSVVVSHFGGGVTRIAADGRTEDILGSGEPVVATNGFAPMPDGSYLCAKLSAPGGVWRVFPDGRQEAFLTDVDGRPLPPCNFVSRDWRGRVWVTVSTLIEPRDQAYRPDVADGLVILVDDGGARIVAEGLGYTNEAIPDPAGEWLYLNETFGRRTSRFRFTDDGLGPRETVATYGVGSFPDGLAFDEEGGLWVTSIVSNRLIRISPDGAQTTVFEDSDPAWLEEVETIFQDGALGRPQLDQNRGQVVKQLSSLAFGGPDRRTLFLGNLLDDRIYTCAAPVAGAAPVHWTDAPV